MKSSQRTLYLVASQGCSLKADAKVRLFSETQNFSKEKFKNMQEIYFTLDKYQSYTIIIPYLLLRAKLKRPIIATALQPTKILILEKRHFSMGEMALLDERIVKP